MLIYRRTSLLESPAQTLVNTVNCVGVMGKGLAKEFKDREPAMYDRYRHICSAGQLKPGTLWLWRGTNNWTLNFPTKVHWRQPSKLEWIESGLEKFLASYKDQGIREISFPRLGCGNGNLEWDEVKPLMESYLKRIDIPVYVHDYTKDIGVPEHLESISGEVFDGINRDVKFETFLYYLHKLTARKRDTFTDLKGEQPFYAEMSEDNDLRIEVRGTCWSYDMEDLHGTWVLLLRGLVTREKIEWNNGGGGDCVLTLLSLLPTTRPIEIQHGPNSEIAVELKPEIRRVTETGSSNGQLALAWH